MNKLKNKNQQLSDEIAVLKVKLTETNKLLKEKDVSESSLKCEVTEAKNQLEKIKNSFGIILHYYLFNLILG